MTPFLLITTRENQNSAQAEYELYLALMGLTRDQLHWIRADQQSLLTLEMSNFAGIVLAGSPYTISEPGDDKGANELRVEAELQIVMQQVVQEDLPFLGICYGMGTLGVSIEAVVDQSFGEKSGSTRIVCTAAGASDKIFRHLPHSFYSYVGHKESVRALPSEATLLATSDACPVQAIRVGNNVYATQFHPELTNEAFTSRVTESAHLGYFAPEELTNILSREEHTDVSASHTIFAEFARQFTKMP